LVESLQSALLDQGWLDKPFAFFGHSVGALIAFELSRSLRNHGGLSPEILFLSGRRAAHIPLRVSALHTLPDRELLYALETFGGFPAEVLNETELIELFLPVLRADLEVDETYVYEPDSPLSCPVSVFGGIEDRVALPDELNAWRCETTEAFTRRLLEGGHFFVDSSRTNLLAAIVEDLVAVGLLRR
jgi:medium-chain acyl-[acyl-carrier-protein] hydrolase